MRSKIDRLVVILKEINTYLEEESFSLASHKTLNELKQEVERSLRELEE